MEALTTMKDIQRSISSLQQANFVNADQTLIYKPVLLWEASGTELVRASNDLAQNQSAFSLGACALNVSLDDQLPYVEGGEVKNNVIDLGESVYWLPRFNGYFYANGEIIKFDAVEYSVYSTDTTDTWLRLLGLHQTQSIRNTTQTFRSMVRCIRPEECVYSQSLNLVKTLMTIP